MGNASSDGAQTDVALDKAKMLFSAFTFETKQHLKETSMDGSESIRYRETRVTSENDYELWHPVALALSCLAAATLVVSWLFQPTRGYWDQLDVTVFRELNGTLAWGNNAWNSVWAVANWRPFDLIVAFLLLLVVGAAVRWQFYRRPLHALVSLLLLCAATLAMNKAWSETLITKTLQYHRGSPTCVLGDANRLNSMVGWVECKDISTHSFPGNHGFILLMVALYVTYFGRKRTAAVAWLISCLCILPRMISGAHWFTDIAVGSASMALVTSGLLFATPIHDYLLSFVPAGKLMSSFSEIASETVAAPARQAAARQASAVRQAAAATVASAPAPQAVRRANLG